MLVQLQNLGFYNLDALDISAEMLKQAEAKSMYGRLICDSVGTKRLDIKDGKQSAD